MQASNQLNAEIDELKLLIELEESNFKYALELQKNCYALMQLKDEIRYLKEKLGTLVNHHANA